MQLFSPPSESAPTSSAAQSPAAPPPAPAASNGFESHRTRLKQLRQAYKNSLDRNKSHIPLPATPTPPMLTASQPDNQRHPPPNQPSLRSPAIIGPATAAADPPSSLVLHHLHLHHSPSSPSASAFDPSIAHLHPAIHPSQALPLQPLPLNQHASLHPHHPSSLTPVIQSLILKPDSSSAAHSIDSGYGTPPKPLSNNSGRIESQSPSSSLKLDHLDLSIIVDPSRLPSSALSTSSSSLDLVKSIEPRDDLGQLDRPSTSHRSFSSPSTALPIQFDRIPASILSSSSSSSSVQEFIRPDSSIKPHIPQPLKITSSFRRSITAPYTASATFPLELPLKLNRLDSITEDGSCPDSSRLDSAFHLTHPPLTAVTPCEPAHSQNLSFKPASEPSLPFNPMDRSGSQSTFPDLSSRTSSSSSSHPNPSYTLLDHSYRKWSGNFYVWVYDTLPNSDLPPVVPSSPTTVTSPFNTSSNLSNHLIGGLSKHFFQHAPFKPSNTSPDSKSTKLVVGKKDRRVKKSLIIGLTKQKDNSLNSSQLESSISLSTHKPSLDPLSLSEQLDALVDRTDIDPAEISRLNQNRFPSSSSSHSNSTKNSTTEPQIHHKSKKNSIGGDPKSTRKRFVTGFGSSTNNSGSGGDGTGNGSITSQLALGPGAAMNSQGLGAGQWKLVQGVIAEDGHFTLHTSHDVILYRIYLPSYRRTDIRMVHQSIFGRLHCGVITRRAASNTHSNPTQLSPQVHTSSTSLPLQSTLTPFRSPNTTLHCLQGGSVNSPPPALLHTAPPSPSPASNLQTYSSTGSSATTTTTTNHQALQQNNPPSGTPELSIYICMPNLVLLESWLVICKCFCRPDDFRHLYPRSTKKNQSSATKPSRSRVLSLTSSQANDSTISTSPRSGTDTGPVKATSSGPLKTGAPERVRIWRGVEIQLLEGRKLGEVQQITISNMFNSNCYGPGGVTGGGINGGGGRLMMKEERRNSTGGFLPTNSQASLLSINKDLLFNKTSNFGKHQTSQQFIISDPVYHYQADNGASGAIGDEQSQQSPYRYIKYNLDSTHSLPGYSNSTTPVLDSGSTHANSHQTIAGQVVHRQSFQTSTPTLNSDHLNHQDTIVHPSLLNSYKIPSSVSTSTIESSTISTGISNSKQQSMISGTTHSNQNNNDHFYFVEFECDKEVLGRSTIKRNANPFWREDFKFSEFGSFRAPMVIKVYQIKKNVNHHQSKSSHNQSPNSSNGPNSSASSSKIQLIGQSLLDFKKFEKNLELQLWLPVYLNQIDCEGSNTTTTSTTTATNSDQVSDESSNGHPNGRSSNMNLYRDVNIIGEINLSLNVFEQVVLAESEYSKMVTFLNNDDDIELPINLANLAVGELDRLAELLIRIYESNDRLLLRLSQLATIEIDGDPSKASILFRANTLLTKMLEAYMRMVGGSFLESSVGSVIRRICMGKIELEIDPSRLKSSMSSNQKEKIIHENAKELNKLSNEIWQSMYINRSKCPNRLRKVFVKIQELVGNSYDDQDMRLTAVSAFVFLRFFVPAILNPRLFNLIQFQPDNKSQRTLTLLAKTVQGLGNLTLFGTKEPWMSVMNEFITSQLDSFRDYISFISRESDSTKPEWTSKEYEGYGLPYALRASLPASSRDGIPTLPHLLDPIRDYSLLATFISLSKRKASGQDSMGNQSSSVLPPKSAKFPDRVARRPRRLTEVAEVTTSTVQVSTMSTTLTNADSGHDTTTEFLKICNELHAKSERRYLKIIQSESKESSKISTSASALPVSAVTTVNASSRTSSLVNKNSSPILLSEALVPSLDISIKGNNTNSKKGVTDHQDRIIEPSSPRHPPRTATLLSSGSTSTAGHRWKRSHTISAEQGSGANQTFDYLTDPPHPPSHETSDIIGLISRKSSLIHRSPKFNMPFDHPTSTGSSHQARHLSGLSSPHIQSPNSRTLRNSKKLSSDQVDELYHEEDTDDGPSVPSLSSRFMPLSSLQESNKFHPSVEHEEGGGDKGDDELSGILTSTPVGRLFPHKSIASLVESSEPRQLIPRAPITGASKPSIYHSLIGSPFVLKKKRLVEPSESSTIGGSWETVDPFNRQLYEDDDDDDDDGGRQFERYRSLSRRSSAKSIKDSNSRKLLIDVRDALQELCPQEREDEDEERKGTEEDEEDQNKFDGHSQQEGTSFSSLLINGKAAKMNQVVNRLAGGSGSSGGASRSRLLSANRSTSSFSLSSVTSSLSSCSLTDQHHRSHHGHQQHLKGLDHMDHQPDHLLLHEPTEMIDPDRSNSTILQFMSVGGGDTSISGSSSNNSSSNSSSIDPLSTSNGNHYLTDHHLLNLNHPLIHRNLNQSPTKNPIVPTHNISSTPTSAESSTYYTPGAALSCPGPNSLSFCNRPIIGSSIHNPNPAAATTTTTTTLTATADTTTTIGSGSSNRNSIISSRNSIHNSEDSSIINISTRPMTATNGSIQVDQPESSSDCSGHSNPTLNLNAPTTLTAPTTAISTITATTTTESTSSSPSRSQNSHHHRGHQSLNLSNHRHRYQSINGSMESPTHPCSSSISVNGICDNQSANHSSTSTIPNTPALSIPPIPPPPPIPLPPTTTPTSTSNSSTPTSSSTTNTWSHRGFINKMMRKNSTAK